MSPTTIVRPDPFWLVTALLVIADQLIKLIAEQAQGAITIGAVSVGVVVNPDGAFGLGLPNGALIPIGVGIVLLLVMLLATGIENRPVRLGLWLMIGGAVSNILDRLFTGGAVDIISIAGLPRFNLADTMIVLGALSILRGMWWRRPS